MGSICHTCVVLQETQVSIVKFVPCRFGIQYAVNGQTETKGQASVSRIVVQAVQLQGRLNFLMVSSASPTSV